ncbi:TonB-dependent receptor [candidate division KSB1 bacterium]|nr:TonB-dependent receptor [candidate division KSB1 bacterium]
MLFQRQALNRSILMGSILLFNLLALEIVLAQPVQTKKDLKGFVKDAKSGEALPFANILLKGTNRGTTTNRDGYFVVVNAPVGQCTLIVRYIGYNAQEVVVTNKSAGIPSLKIELKPTVLEVEGVTVIAQAAMLEAANQVSQFTFSPRQLSSLPSIGEIDIFRTMQLLPGISGVGDGSSGLYVRGGTPDQNLVIFDGMTIYHVDHFFGFFSAFNTDAVKDIQVFKGGFPAEYGGRISSVVNLTGKTGDQNQLRFGYGINLLSAHGYFESPISDWGTFILTGRRSYTDFIRSPLYDNIYGLLTGEENGGATGGPVRFGDGPPGRGFGQQQAEFKPSFYFYDLNSKLTLNPTSRDIFTFSFYSGKDDLDKSQDFSDSGNLRFRGTDIDVSLKTTDFTRWGNLGFSGKWSRQLSNRFHVDLLSAYSRYFSEYDRSSNVTGMAPPASGGGENTRRSFSNASKEDNIVTDLTNKLDFNWLISSAHALNFGYNFTQFNNDYNAIRDDSIKIFSRNGEARLHAFYLQDLWKYKSLAITAGVRGSLYNQTNAFYYEPRASFSYSLTRKIQVKGAWGQYFQFVNQIANEDVTQGARDFWLLADEDFSPSFAEHQILGLSYENDNYLFSVEGYHKNLKDLIEFSRRYVMRGPGRATGIAPVENFFIGNGTAKGLEFLLQKKRGAITGWIGYTLGKVDYTFPAINKGMVFPADHDRRHEVNVVAKYNLGVYSFAATWVYASGSPYTAPESQYFIPLLDGEVNSYIHVSDKNANRLPDYQRLDLSASRKFESDNWATEIGVSLFNTYNHKNVWYREYNLDTTPITITDVVMLGFTPTVYIQMNLK